MDSGHDVDLVALTPQLADRWLAFFDHDAFADNPSWASCYCRVFHFPGGPSEWDRACEAKENRAPMLERVRRGEIDGHLAVRGGQTVGWCQWGPRGRFRIRHGGVLATDAAEDARVGAIVCFVIAARERRQGVASRLLEAACQGLAVRGFAAAEGYPLLEPHVEPGIPPEAELFRGPRELFLGAGFREVGRTERLAILRKDLAPPAAAR